MIKAVEEKKSISLMNNVFQITIIKVIIKLS
jgi:hypothetical protein